VIVLAKAQSILYMCVEAGMTKVRWMVDTRVQTAVGAAVLLLFSQISFLQWVDSFVSLATFYLWSAMACCSNKASDKFNVGPNFTL